MGEAWRVVNLTKRERLFSYDEKMDDFRLNAEMEAALRRLLSDGRWVPTDDIRAVSDYGGTEPVVLGEANIGVSGGAIWEDLCDLTDRYPGVADKDI